MPCRLCLKGCESISSKLLFGSSGEMINSQLTKLIVKYLYLEIKPNDKYSKMICQQCVHNLEQFDEYCQYVEQQQLLLCETILPITSENAEQNDSASVLNVKGEIFDVPCDSRSFLNDWLPDYEDTNDSNFRNETSNTRIAKMSENEIIAKYVKLNCNICADASNTFDDLKSHFQKEHNIAQGYAYCCNKRFFHQSKLLEHAKHHQSSENVELQSVTKLFSNKNMNANHSEKDAVNKIDNNEEVEDKDNTNSTASEEHQRYIKKEPEICFIEQVEEDEDDDIKYSDSLFHRSSGFFSESSEKLSNFLLNETYNNSAIIESSNTRSLTVEELDENNLQYRICNICQKTLKTTESLRVHMIRSHKNIKPFTCSLCGNAFSTRFTLDRHTVFCIQKKNKLKRKSNEQPLLQNKEASKYTTTNTNSIKCYVCNICNKKHSSMGALKIHKYRWHKNMHPFSCSDCEARFNTALELKQHKSNCYVTMEQPELETASRYDRLHKNQRIDASTYHDGAYTDENDIKLRTCRICQITSTTVEGLRTHMDLFHHNDLPFACSKCGRKFSQVQTLYEHMIKCSENLKQESYQVSFDGENIIKKEIIEMDECLFGGP